MAQVKVGDKVRYTGKAEYDLTPGRVYEISKVLYDGSFFVTDDIGDENSFASENYELITSTEPTEYDYAAQAAKHGITITVGLGDDVVIFDGRK